MATGKRFGLGNSREWSSSLCRESYVIWESDFPLIFADSNILELNSLVCQIKLRFSPKYILHSCVGYELMEIVGSFDACKLLFNFFYSAFYLHWKIRAVEVGQICAKTCFVSFTTCKTDAQCVGTFRFVDFIFCWQPARRWWRAGCISSISQASCPRFLNNEFHYFLSNTQIHFMYVTVRFIVYLQNNIF